MSQPRRRLKDFDDVAFLFDNPVAKATAMPRKHESVTYLSSYAPIPVYEIPKVESIRYLARRRRIEAALIPAMAFEVIHYWNATTRFDTERLKHEFTTAIEQMIAGSTMDQATRLAVSTIETAQKLMHRHKGGFFKEGSGQTWEKIAMVMYFLACDLTAEGYFELNEGSVMHRGLEGMREAALKILAPEQVGSAEKQARQLLKFLREQKGHFIGD